MALETIVSLYIGDRVIIIDDTSYNYRQKGYVVALESSKVRIKIDRGKLEWFEVAQLDVLFEEVHIPIGESWMNLSITDHAVQRWQKWIHPRLSKYEVRNAIREVFLNGYLFRGKEEKLEIVFKTYAIVVVVEDFRVTVVTSYLITRPMNLEYKIQRGKKITSSVIRSKNYNNNIRE